MGFSFVTDNEVIKKKLPDCCSVFTAELYAVFTAVKHIFTTGKYDTDFIIFTDSMSVLTSLKNFMSSNFLVREVQDLVMMLQSRKRISIDFCWVPGHVGIRGNEKADEAAKEAVRIGSVLNTNVPLDDFRRKVRAFISNRWHDHWSNLSSNTKLRAICPSVFPCWSSLFITRDRRESIVSTRLRIGHCHLTHKYLLCSGDDRHVPVCDICNTDLTVYHVLVDCRKYLNERRTNNLNGRSIQEILSDNFNIRNVFSFLKQINIFYDI